MNLRGKILKSLALGMPMKLMLMILQKLIINKMQVHHFRQLPRKPKYRRNSFLYLKFALDLQNSVMHVTKLVCALSRSITIEILIIPGGPLYAWTYQTTNNAHYWLMLSKLRRSMLYLLPCHAEPAAKLEKFRCLNFIMVQNHCAVMLIPEACPTCQAWIC